MNWRNTIIKYKLHHFLLWGLLYAGWHYFRYQDYPAGTAAWITFIKVADLALLVYITNYLLIPYLLYRKRYIVFVAVFIVVVFSSSIFKMYIEEMVFGTPGFFGLRQQLKVRIYDNVIPHLLLVSTGAAIKLLIDYARAQKRLGDLAKEKAETELQFLKSQINPHFLFNSLNAIYFLIDKQNAEARQTLLQFSDLLRYQLYDCNAPTIEIEKELAYLQDYVRLQQLRKDKQYEVKMETGGDMNGFRITPLLLIPFVENAFKHISHDSSRKNFVHITMARQNGSFSFTVSNSKDSHRSTEPRGGIGLANVKRRLELVYPGRHLLRVDNSDDVFTVEMQLKIDNHMP
jgi:two-component system, LytTR family, sensor kinase